MDLFGYPQREAFLHNVHISPCMNKEIFLIMIRCARETIIAQETNR